AFSDKPIYNLKAVLEKTGIKADALRAWERRYGLPEPQRSSGKQRLYSEYDVEIIKWLLTRQSEGMRISQAVESWKALSLSGLDPLDDTPILKRYLKENAGTVDISGNVDELRAQWIEACKNYNETLAEDILNQAFAISPIPTVCTQLLQQALRELGEMWYRGQVTAQQEHFASALCVRRLEALISATPRPQFEENLVLGCAPGEWHTLPVLMINLFLRRKGINVVYLGADLPIEQLLDSIKQLSPALVIITAQQLNTAVSLRKIFDPLKQQGYNLAYGGLVFNRIPGLRRFIPAHFLGEDISSSIQYSEELYFQRPPQPEAEVISPVVIKAAQIFEQKRSLIEAQVLQEIPAEILSRQNLNMANLHMGNGILSALSAGDINFLTSEMEWARDLPGTGAFFAMLNLYCKVCAQAVITHLGKDGEIISDWLLSYSNSLAG
ncbi:MAG: MerR family transcriptional regulator, partial [Anaerolineae bacterium]|nr:MerR family transcriptional regulator [Anaerolineae bacterium]